MIADQCEPLTARARALVPQLAAELDHRLAEADRTLERNYPGDRSGRQPVHTVYVPADRYHKRLVLEYGAAALAMLEKHRAGFAGLVRDEDIVHRVEVKLKREPVEDLRVDFEDGYLGRTSEDEDRDAVLAATAFAASQSEQSAAPFGGIRVKCFDASTRTRALRTLTSFVSALLETGGTLDSWVVTLPKVTSVAQVEAMLHVCDAVERTLDLAAGRLRFEVQVETPQSILGADGTALVARMVHVAGERLTGLHYGTYDYSAYCGIAAEQQSLAHPVADHAKAVMQTAVAGTGVRLSDGSTNLLPVGGPEDVDAAWGNHYRLVRRSLARGFYQGWDLHPGQLPTRFAATYAFYRDGLPQALARLADYSRSTSTAIADEPATTRALAAFVFRGMDCGAVDPAEVASLTDLRLTVLHDLARPRR